MSAIESPKLMIDLKFQHCVSELKVVTKRVDKTMKIISFINREESEDAMRERSSEVGRLRRPSKSKSIFFYIYFVQNNFLEKPLFAGRQLINKGKKQNKIMQ